VYPEWWITDYKFSLMRELWSKGFPDLNFAPRFPGVDDERDEANRFHLSYPLGQFDRPCFGCEYNSSTAPGKVGGLGLFTQASTFTLYILGLNGQEWDVERKIGQAIEVLHAKQIRVYEWNPKVKRFDEPGVRIMQALYAGDRMNSLRQQSDKPEASITFTINH
jgi:hypothetical protein